MNEIAIFICSFCKESFDSGEDITCHMLNTHNSNKTVKRLQEKLTKQNTKKPSLKPKASVNDQKKPSHSEQVKQYGKEFYCDVCNYKTVYLSTYKRHLIKHEKGGRQHKCKYCSYAAVQPHNLKVHLNSVHPFGAVEPVIGDNIDVSWIYS